MVEFSYFCISGQRCPTRTMEKQLDLIGIGECLVEFSHTGSGNYQIGYSGDVLNALAAAGRLGLSTGLLSAIGDDPFTSGLLDILQDDGIDLSHCPVLDSKPNGVYFISLDAMGIPTFHFLRKYSAAREMFNVQPMDELIEYVHSARALLFSSIPIAIIEHAEKLFHLLETVRGKTIIGFDLNIRPVLWNNVGELNSILDRLAPLVDVLFVSNEDDNVLFGPRHTHEAVEDYARRGFQEIVFRRGGATTMVRCKGEQFEVPVPHIPKIIDSTGAEIGRAHV